MNKKISNKFAARNAYLDAGTERFCVSVIERLVASALAVASAATMIAAIVSDIFVRRK